MSVFTQFAQCEVCCSCVCLENGCFHRRGDVNQKVWGDHAINCCYVLSGVDLRVKLFDKGQGPQPLSRLREQIRTDLSVGFLCYRPFCMFQRQPGLIESDCLTLVRVFGNLLRQESLWEIACVHYYSWSDWQIKCSFEPIYFDPLSVTLVVRCHVGKEIAPN